MVIAPRLRNFFQTFSQGYGRYRYRLILLVLLGFVGGIFEGIGINALVPLLGLITNSLPAEQNRINHALERIAESIGYQFDISYLIIAILTLFVIKALFLLVFHYISIRFVADYERTTRQELLHATLQADWPYLMREKIGYLEKIIMVDTDRSTHLIRSLNDTILTITSLLIYVVVALSVSPSITIVALGLGTLIFFIFKPLLHKTARVSAEYADLNKQAAHHINENMIGIKTIKALDAESKIFNRSRELFSKLRGSRIKLYVLGKLRYILSQPISIFFLMLLFTLNYRLPDFDFASFAVTLYLMQKIFAYIENAQNGIHSVAENTPYLRSTVRHLTASSRQAEYAGARNSFSFLKLLTFNDVKFIYENSPAPVLAGISMEVPRGSMIGIIGPSGAGKTTIVDMLLRLLKPSSGTIQIDGQDIFQIDIHDWRRHIGYVSQDIFLLNDTISSNIKFFDASISDKQVVQAASIANIDTMIDALPDKYNTVVGERGILLSAGQRQRIVLARVLARNPEILILDEATSALDNESEAAIQSALNRLRGVITVIIIAHRLTTVLNTDELYIVRDGKIIERGSPEALRNLRESYFYKLYNLQSLNSYA